MKTLIAALALSVAVSAPAFADVSEGGLGTIFTNNASNVQVSGFVGTSELRPAIGDVSEGGAPLVINAADNAQISGFTGIASGEFRPAMGDVSEGGIGAVLR